MSANQQTDVHMSVGMLQKHHAVGTRSSSLLLVQTVLIIIEHTQKHQGTCRIHMSMAWICRGHESQPFSNTMFMEWLPSKEIPKGQNITLLQQDHGTGHRLCLLSAIQLIHQRQCKLKRSPRTSAGGEESIHHHTWLNSTVHNEHTRADKY